MPSIYQLKPAFQSVLRPIVKLLAKMSISANQVTILALILSFVVGYLLFSQVRIWLVLLPAFLFIRMALNAIDGLLAREHNMKTNLGIFLNELSDVLADAALYLPFAWLIPQAQLLVITLVILSIVAEMTGVVAVQAGASRRYDGPSGKSDRAFFFSILGVLLYFDISLHWIGYDWYIILIGIVNGLLLLTIYNRIKNALREIGP